MVDRRREFALQLIGRASVIDLLRQHLTQRGADGGRLRLTIQDRDELLRELDGETDLLKKLCIHAEHVGTQGVAYIAGRRDSVA